MNGFAIVLLSLLTACDQAENAPKKAEAERAQKERAAAHERKRSEELAIMSDPARAVPELERRLDEWLVSRDGVIYVSEGSEKFPVIHAMPASTPWLLSCSTSGVKITVGNWTEVDEGHTFAMFEMTLTQARLGGDKCNALLPPLSARMRNRLVH